MKRSLTFSMVLVGIYCLFSVPVVFAQKAKQPISAPPVASGSCTLTCKKTNTDGGDRYAWTNPDECGEGQMCTAKNEEGCGLCEPSTWATTCEGKCVKYKLNANGQLPLTVDEVLGAH
jgi:hypothetical protein